MMKLEGLFIGFEIRCEPTLIADSRAQAFGFEDRFQRMKRFGTHLNGLGHRFGAEGDDHELLDIQVIGGMGAAVDHVHHGHRQDPGVDTTQVAEQGQAEAHWQPPGPRPWRRPGWHWRPVWICWPYRPGPACMRPGSSGRRHPCRGFHSAMVVLTLFTAVTTPLPP
jgi:hypothetical protein